MIQGALPAKRHPKARSEKLWLAVGARVREARTSGPVSQPHAFALAAHISRQMLDMLEKGERSATLETLYAIARASGKPIAFFLPDPGDL